MATKFYKFTGPVKWAKVYEPEEFRGSVNWKLDQYLDDDQLAVRKEAGIQSKVYDDEEGKFVSWKRPKTKVIKDVLNEFAPPTIFNADGDAIVSYHKEDNEWVRDGDVVLIGNGSVCEVTVAVYDTQMGKGQRLESIRILDLVEYNPEGGSGFGNTIQRGETKGSASVKTPWGN